MITAIVFVHADNDRISEVAEQIAGLEHVTGSTSVTGDIDLVVMVRVAGTRRSRRPSPIQLKKVPGVIDTDTHRPSAPTVSTTSQAAFSPVAGRRRRSPSLGPDRRGPAGPRRFRWPRARGSRTIAGALTGRAGGPEGDDRGPPEGDPDLGRATRDRLGDLDRIDHHVVHRTIPARGGTFGDLASPSRIESITSIPSTSCPNTECLPSR